MATTQEQIAKLQAVKDQNSKSWFGADQSTQQKLHNDNLGITQQLADLQNQSRSYNAASGTYAFADNAPAQPKPPSYLDQMTGQIGNMFDQQKAAQLAALKAQRDQATGQLNQQKSELAPRYYGLKNQAGADNAQQIQHVREVMAANGLSGNTAGSGENITANVGLGAALQNNLGNLSLQQQQQENDISRRISDLNNPAQEQALIANIEAAKSQMLYDAQQKAHQFDYQVGRDQQGDAFTRGQMLGNYTDPQAQALAQQIYNLKMQNATGGNAGLQANADQLRAQLGAMGYDSNALFGADVTAQQALSNIGRLGAPTLQKQQQDYQKSTDQRNFNYQVGRDNVGDQRDTRNYNYQVGRDQVGDTRYNNEFAYKQQRDSVGDTQRNQEFNWQKQYQTAGLTGMFDGNPTMAKVQNDQDVDYKKYLKQKGLSEDQGVKATNGYISQALGKGSRDEAINYINQNADHIVNDGGNITQILTALNQKWASPNTSYDPYGLGK